MTCLIVLRLKILLVCNSAVTVASLKKFKKIHINYGFVVFLIDNLVIVALIVVILVVSVVVYFVIKVDISIACATVFKGY